jgi:copper chaperone CopZ
MKTIIAILSFFFFAFNASAQTKEVTIKLGAYCDHFEQCETGKSRLEKELVFTKGIKDVKTDSQAKTVTVKFNSKKTSEHKIREAISKAGYDADDVKADPKGFAKLDECCKKRG